MIYIPNAYALTEYKDGDSIKSVSATSISSSSTSLSSGFYVVDSDITIDNRITINGDVSIILSDGISLNAKEGINVSSGNTLTIYGGKLGTGKLVANSSNYNAGIGANSGVSSGKIIINGGVIESNGNGGSHGSAGIGGAGTSSWDSSKDAGTIIINGGTVTASGACHASGIGTGYNTGTGIVIINGGTINATGGSEGAGIGGTSITINGGTINATSAWFGAGIGNGRESEHKDTSIKINGGTINAQGSGGAPGIGVVSSKATIEITGGNITANGGDNGAGIGTGQNFSYDISITISGGNITANGGINSAGIGGGVVSSGGDITISGGTVKSSAGAMSEVSENSNIIEYYPAMDIGYGGGYSEEYCERDYNAPLAESSSCTIKIRVNYIQTGTFKTEANGNAVIYANTIGDESGKANWSGIILTDDEVTVYGNQTLNNDLTINKDEKLVIEDGASLTIPEDIILTNNGTIISSSIINGKVNNSGTIEITINSDDNQENIITDSDNVTTTKKYDSKGKILEYIKEDADGKIIEKITYNENGSYVKYGFVPEIIEGMNSITNGTYDLTIRSNDEFINFIKVLVNGIELDKNSYTVESGSIKVLLSSSYLSSLDNGTYTVEIVSTNGSASTTFKVDKEVEDNISNPQTYDNIYSYIETVLLSIISILFSLIYIKKSNKLRI
jgi:hypothetical protein